MIVSKITPPPDAIVRPASQLAVGDRIAARFLPTRDPATIVFVLPYELAGKTWMFLVHRDGVHAPEPSWFQADEPVWLESVADASGVDFSDLGDRLNAEYTPVPADVEGHAEFSRTAQAAEPVTRYFSFGHGQTDPLSGKNLLNHYVTVVAATAEDCREAMLASRFGREWAFEYTPGTVSAEWWIPQWTEHERIDATGLRPGEHGRVTNPNLAQFLAGKEHKRREAARFLGLTESAKHYPADPIGVVEGDLAAEQYDNAAARYERDA